MHRDKARQIPKLLLIVMTDLVEIFTFMLDDIVLFHRRAAIFKLSAPARSNTIAVRAPI